MSDRDQLAAGPERNSPALDRGGLVDQVNAIGVADDRAERFRSARSMSDGTLAGFVEALVGISPGSQHLRELLGARPAVGPVLLGVANAVADTGVFVTVKVTEGGPETAVLLSEDRIDVDVLEYLG